MKLLALRAARLKTLAAQKLENRKCLRCLKTFGRTIKPGYKETWPVYRRRRFCSRNCLTSLPQTKCETCKKKFRRSPQGRLRFCSWKCRKAAQAPKLKTRFCRACKKPISRYMPSGAFRSDHRYQLLRFCSRVCGKSKVRRPLRFCKFCKKPCGRSPVRKWCSNKCRKAAGGFVTLGSWKGKTTLTTKNWGRAAQEAKAWSEAVYARDKSICRRCGEPCKARGRIAHHVKSYDKYPALRYRVSNGLTLCRACHKKEHPEIGAKTQFGTPGGVAGIQKEIKALRATEKH